MEGGQTSGQKDDYGSQMIDEGVLLYLAPPTSFGLLRGGGEMEGRRGGRGWRREEGGGGEGLANPNSKQIEREKNYGWLCVSHVDILSSLLYDTFLASLSSQSTLFPLSHHNT